MLGDQRTDRMVCGLGGYLVSEVNLGIACHCIIPSRAATALSDWFVIRQSDLDNAQYRQMACSAFCSLGKLRDSSPIT